MGIVDTGAAVELLMGRLVRDLQVRMLFGAAPAATPDELQRRAQAAVDAFLRLYTD